ncbi:MAG: DUF982 domain-containing protein [Pseudorhizobium sp.]
MNNGSSGPADPSHFVGWTHPVHVTLEPRTQTCVRSAEEAMRALAGAWPVRSGAHQTKAIRLCMLALQRQTSQEVAREGFISAALEAGILSLGPHFDHAKLGSAAVPQEHV